jgi:hypothetical protein
MSWFRVKQPEAPKGVSPLVKWEYMIVPMTSRIEEADPDIMDHKELLNAYGAVGWELVTMRGDFFILKKPVC